MGKTEKIVVLSVLFAVVVLFVWSLQGPEARAAAAGGGARGPMSGIAPNDPGVDISALTGIMGNTWKKLAENKE